MTSLNATEVDARTLYQKAYCARGEVENRIKEQQLDLFADRTSAATMGANQLRFWLASFGYVLVEALRRIGLRFTQFANATCATLRLELLKIALESVATTQPPTAPTRGEKYGLGMEKADRDALDLEPLPHRH